MKNIKRLGLGLLSFVLVTISCFMPSMTLQAAGIVGMSTDIDNVQRGVAFKVYVTATGATAGVDGMQVFLSYDNKHFQFVKANSQLLETAGSQISDAADGSARTMKDDGSTVSLVAYMQPGQPTSDTVAVLEFVCKADAPIGPSSFAFTGNSFVSVVGSGKVAATPEKLNLGIVESNLEAGAQAQPYTPTELTAATMVAADPNMPPMDSNNLIPSQAALGTLDGSAYGVNVANEETTAAATTAASSSATTRATTAPTQPPTTTVGELRSTTGELLTPVELDTKDIPTGMKGDSAQIHGQTIKIVKDSERNLQLYYLSTGSKAAFYTYEQGSDRFALYDMAKLKASSSESQTKRGFQTGGAEGNTWRIIILSLVCVSSLIVLIYSVYKNVRGV